MSEKRISILIGILALAAMLAVWGCEGDQGPEGPAGPQGPAGPSELNAVAILTVFNGPQKAFDYGHLTMNLYNVPSMPSVQFNDSLLMPDEEALHIEGRLQYSGSYYLNGDDSASLNIAYTKLDGTSGAGSSKISLPTEFAPVDEAITVPYGDDFEAEWSMSEGADAYWIYGFFGIIYDDTSDVRDTIILEFDTVLVVNDTTLTVPAAAFLPDITEVNAILAFAGVLYIKAVTGPWMPGEANNFTGDVFGIFTGVTDGVWIDYDLLVVVKSQDDINREVEIDKSRIDETFNARIVRILQE